MNARALQIAEWSAIAGVGAAGFLNAFSPTPYEIRHEVTQQGDLAANLADLRQCYAKAGLLSAGLGIAASLIVESAWPLLVTAGVTTAMIASYESALPPDYRLLTRRPAAISAPGRSFADFAEPRRAWQGG